MYTYMCVFIYIYIYMYIDTLYVFTIMTNIACSMIVIRTCIWFNVKLLFFRFFFFKTSVYRIYN